MTLQRLLRDYRRGLREAKELPEGSPQWRDAMSRLDYLAREIDQLDGFED